MTDDFRLGVDISVAKSVLWDAIEMAVETQLQPFTGNRRFRFIDWRGALIGEIRVKRDSLPELRKAMEARPEPINYVSLDFHGPLYGHVWGAFTAATNNLELVSKSNDRLDVIEFSNRMPALLLRLQTLDPNAKLTVGKIAVTSDDDGEPAPVPPLKWKDLTAPVAPPAAKRRVPIWLRWVGGVVTLVIAAVVAGIILHAFGQV